MTLVKPGYFVYLQFWNGCCNARYNSWQPQNAFSFFALLYGWLLMIVFCFLIFCLLVLILRVYVQASCGYLESDLYCIAISLAFLARSLYSLYSPFPFAFHRFHGNVDGPAIDSLFTCCLAPFNIRGKKDCQNCLRRWCLCFCTLKHEDSKISEFPATTPEDVLGWCDISFWPPPQIPIRRLVSVFSFPLPQTPAAWKLKWVAHIWKSTRAKRWSVQLTFHLFAPFSSFSAVFFLRSWFAAVMLLGRGFQGTSCICVCAVEIPGTGGDTSQFSDPTVGAWGQQRQRHCASSFPTSARVQTPLIGNWKTKFQEKKGMNRNEAFRMLHPATVAAASERTTARTHTHTKRGGSKVGKNGTHHTIY